MIRIGNAIINEDHIAAILTGDDIDIAASSVLILKTGDVFPLGSSIEDVIDAFAAAGYVDPLPRQTAYVFTPEELVEMSSMYNSGFRFFAKDADGRVYAYTTRPRKGSKSWIEDASETQVRRLDCHYSTLYFEMAEPLDLAEVLGDVHD